MTLEPLSEPELLALAAAARELMTVDGEVSDGEFEAAAAIAARVGLTAEQWRQVWDRTSSADRSARDALEGVTRAEAREVIYELLYALASDESINDPEWDLLEWIDETWGARTD